MPIQTIMQLVGGACSFPWEFCETKFQYNIGSLFFWMVLAQGKQTNMGVASHHKNCAGGVQDSKWLTNRLVYLSAYYAVTDKCIDRSSIILVWKYIVGLPRKNHRSVRTSHFSAWFRFHNDGGSSISKWWRQKCSIG